MKVAVYVELAEIERRAIRYALTSKTDKVQATPASRREVREWFDITVARALESIVRDLPPRRRMLHDQE